MSLEADPNKSPAEGSLDGVSLSGRRAAMGFILLTLFIDILGIGLIIPVLPDLVRELWNTNLENEWIVSWVMKFGNGTNQSSGIVYGCLISVYALMQFLAAPLIGALSDRFGRRPVLLISILGLAADFLLTFFAWNLTWLFIARLASGITSANITAANAYIADISTAKDRVKNFGLFGATIGIAFILGPATGGYFGQENPRLPFLIAAGLAGINFVYGLFVLPESLPPSRRAKKLKWSFNPLGGILVLRRYPEVARLALTIFCVAMAQQSLQSTWMPYTEARFQWTPLQRGFSMAAVGVLTAIMQGGLVGRITAKIGPRRAFLTGLCAASLAFIGYGCATQGWMMYVAMCVGAFGGLVMPVAQSTVARLVPSNEQGAVQGGLTSLTSLCAIVAPVAANVLRDNFNRGEGLQIPGIVFFLASFSIAIGAIIAWRAPIAPAVSPGPAAVADLASSTTLDPKVDDASVEIKSK